MEIKLKLYIQTILYSIKNVNLISKIIEIKFKKNVTKFETPSESSCHLILFTNILIIKD